MLPHKGQENLFPCQLLLVVFVQFFHCRMNGYSSMMSRPLYVQNSIVAVEYFLDDLDPGEGKAIAVSLPIRLVEPFIFDVETDVLTVGMHLFNLRAKDETGKWSVLRSVPFEVIDAATLINPLVIDNSIIESIFTLDGRKVDALQKGMNIIRMSNGTTKTVYVK